MEPLFCGCLRPLPGFDPSVVSAGLPDGFNNVRSASCPLLPSRIVNAGSLNDDCDEFIDSTAGSLLEEPLDRRLRAACAPAPPGGEPPGLSRFAAPPPGGNDGNLPWLLEPLALDPGGANCCCLAEGLGEFAGESLLLRLPPLAGEASLAGDGDGALPGEGGALGLFLTFAQIGMCLSATAESKRRPQCGHGTIPSGALRAGEA